MLNAWVSELCQIMKGLGSKNDESVLCGSSILKEWKRKRTVEGYKAKS